MVRWLKKSSNETCLPWSHIHEKSRWLNFKMTQNLDHEFLLRWLTFSIIKTEMAQKIEPTEIAPKRHVIEILSHFEIEPCRFLMHMTSRETCLLRWLFEPSQHTPVFGSEHTHTYRRNPHNFNYILRFNVKARVIHGFRDFFCWISLECPRVRE